MITIDAREDEDESDTEVKEEVQEPCAKFNFSVRFFYSRLLFQASLLDNLEQLIAKEHEYLYFLQKCVEDTLDVIVKT